MQKEKEWSQRRQKRAGLLSNIKVGKKMFLIFLLAVLSAVLIFVLMINSVYHSERRQKEATEKMAVASAEQYINAAIENITAIAQNLYSNSSLYQFLNQSYASSAAYYDAYFQLKSNNSLSVAQNRNIEKFYIYTDNSTILRGGDIYKLSSVQHEEWYNSFLSANKNMILYCDGKTRRLSMIQKLDYMQYSTEEMSESYLKIDFNSAMLDSYFDGLDFGGKLYVLSGGIVLYSNTDEAPESIQITPDYCSLYKNYYSVELEYYAAAPAYSYGALILRESASIIGFLLFLAAAVVIAALLCHNITARISQFSTAFGKEDLTAIRGFADAKDEIGKMIGQCVSLSDRMELKQRELKKSNQTLEETRADASAILIQALHQDAALAFGRKYASPERAAAVQYRDFSEPIPLESEIRMLSEKLREHPQFQHAECAALSERVYILPCALLLTADLLLELLAQEQGTGLSVAAKMNAPKDSLHITFSADAKLGTNKILKLLAIFEDHPEQTDFTFKPDYIYNPCIRIKQFYGSDVSIRIDADEGFVMTLQFSRALLLNGADGFFA